MTLRYAATFQQSLDRLTAPEQKQVKITTVDLMFDPAGNGLQLHRVEKAAGFWTARVSQDIRLVHGGDAVRRSDRADRGAACLYRAGRGRTGAGEAAIRRADRRSAA
jgi:hypothetical protein